MTKNDDIYSSSSLQTLPSNLTATSLTEAPYIVNWKNFVACSIAIVGFLLTAINIAVFIRLRDKDPIYKFLLLASVLDLLYLGFLAITNLFNCGTPCASINSTLLAKLYILLIDDYLSSSIAFNNVLVEIFLSLQRLYIIMNKRFWVDERRFKSVVIALALFALAFYYPVIFLKRIIVRSSSSNEHANDVVYAFVSTEFGKSEVGKAVPSILSGIRIFLATICLFVINAITFIMFKKHLRKKQRLVACRPTQSTSSGAFYFFEVYYYNYCQLKLNGITYFFLYK